MRESGNYPPGAENDPNAPWNEKRMPEREFKVNISQGLSRIARIKTDDYQICDNSDEGIGYEIITEDTNWERAYDNDSYTPLELIDTFRSLLVKVQDMPDRPKGFCYKELIKACEGWIEDYYEVIED